MTDQNSTPTKVCTKCGESKPATPEFFHAYKRSPDGRRSVCRECRAAHYAANQPEVRARRKEFYSKNRERLTAASREYYVQNTERQKEAAKKRWFRNIERNTELMKKRYAENREAYLEKKRIRGKERWRELYGSDIRYTLKARTSALLSVTMRRTGTTKSARMVELLGYDVSDLKAHLESLFVDGMTWEKYLSGEIHVDHIRPVASFDIKSDRCPEFKKCWSLDNLQPLWAKDNLSKGAKYDPDNVAN